MAAGRKILVCVTGGIAAYKTVQVVRDLAILGADVHVVMTASARRFVGAQTLASVSGNRVSADFEPGPEVTHVELARGADLVVVAPATANALAKMALGIADDLFSAALLMVRCPVLVAPAMHTEMWEHPATRGHAATLSARGTALVGPAAGALLSGDEGPGRMSEPEEIVAAALELLARTGALAGRRVVVTAGGTQEPIDPVRFIGNRSSGLMGFAVAEEARRRGARVVLVAGNVSAELPPGLEVTSVRTAEEMKLATEEAASEADVVVMAAAVADFRPAESAPVKLKKAHGPPEIKLVPTPDILEELGAAPRPRPLLVGFAAETESDAGALGRVAEDKRRSKGADVIVANDVASPDSGFGVRTNRAVIASDAGIADLGLVSKAELAAGLLDTVAELLAVKPTRKATGGSL